MPTKFSTSPPLSMTVLQALFWLLHSVASLLVQLASIPRILFTLLPHRTGLDLALLDRLEKLPKHISFLVMEPVISCPDLARLIVWAVRADIPQISLYDPRGELKSRQVELLQQVREVYQDHSGTGRRPLNLAWRPHVRSDTVIVSCGGKLMYPDRNGNNSSEEKGMVTVSLLSLADGKPDIVSAARALASKVRAGELLPGEVTEDKVSSTLLTNRGLPDPCLLVRFGDVSSNGDFPPWHLRLTEMHSVPSHRGVTVGDFERILCNFGKCQQRLGK